MRGPVLIRPYDPPGLLARLAAWLPMWLWRLFVFVVIFGLGYGCRALTG
jgi:hypothetical protein